MKITPNISVLAALTALQEARPQPIRAQTAGRVLDPDDRGRRPVFDPDDAAKQPSPGSDAGAVREKPSKPSTAKARRSAASGSPDTITTGGGGHLVAPAFRRESVGPVLGTAGPGLGLVFDIKV